MLRSSRSYYKCCWMCRWWYGAAGPESSARMHLYAVSRRHNVYFVAINARWVSRNTKFRHVPTIVHAYLLIILGAGNLSLYCCCFCCCCCKAMLWLHRLPSPHLLSIIVHCKPDHRPLTDWLARHLRPPISECAYEQLSIAHVARGERIAPQTIRWTFAVACKLTTYGK